MTPADDLWNDLPWIREAPGEPDRWPETIGHVHLMADRLDDAEEPLEILLAGTTGRRVFTVTEDRRFVLSIAVHEGMRGLVAGRDPFDDDPTWRQRQRSFFADVLRRAATAPTTRDVARIEDADLYAAAIAAGLDDRISDVGIRVLVRPATPLLPALATFETGGRGKVAVPLPTGAGAQIHLSRSDGCITLCEGTVSLPFGPFAPMERLRLEQGVLRVATASS